MAIVINLVEKVHAHKNFSVCLPAIWQDVSDK